MGDIFVQGMCILAYALFNCVMIAGYMVMESWPDIYHGCRNIIVCGIKIILDINL